MIAYICKYAPAEIIKAFGTETLLVEPQTANFNQADSLMHPNMCSFIKSVLEDFSEHDYEGMILTTCCDSSRRLYDILVKNYPDKFFFCMDLPRKINDYTVSDYAAQMQKLIKEYSVFSGKEFNEKKLIEICDNADESKEESENCDLQVCLAGARPGSGIKRLIESKGAHIALDLSCTAAVRSFSLRKEDPLESYAASLLGQMPCMRMAASFPRDEAILKMKENIDGIIYHTVKFCDIYSYEYTHLRDISGLPILKIETDATSQSQGQILTRVEAFLEALRAQKTCSVCGDKTKRLSMKDVKEDKAAEKTVRKGRAMVVMGIDSGSTSTNAVIMNEKKEIIASDVVRTGAKSGESADRILTNVLNKAGLRREDIDVIVSTGYGRVSIPFADRNVTEISCHAKGAHFLNPKVRTILDIGGQDSKAIRLNDKGDVIDFVMNDKCAAGTGRFLEMMARTLEISIEELGPVSLKSKENIKISSMCSVFAESEVISLIAQNKDTADIAHGIHEAIAGKAISLMKRVGLEKDYMMTGGVAKNPGVVKTLEEQLGAPIYIYEEPEIVGAIGAALYGLE